MSSLGIEFPKEQARVRAILKIYHQLGDAGEFGAAVIETTLQQADVAAISGNPIEVLQAFEALKGVEA